MINAEYSIGIKQILFITTTHKQSYETWGGGGGEWVCKASESPQDGETAGSTQRIDAYKILGKETKETSLRNLVIANLANIKTHDLVPSG